MMTRDTPSSDRKGGALQKQCAEITDSDTGTALW
jgi:hypothetical protein